MAKVSRAYIKSAGKDQSGSIQAGSTIYAQDILDLIDSAKWHDEGIDNVYYDDTSHSIKVVKSSDPEHPVSISVPKNSDIVKKLVKGKDKYELRSDTGLVAKTDLPSTLVTSVACDKAANELKVSSTSSNSGITVPLPDSLKSAAIKGNSIAFNSLDGEKSVVNLPDSLKSVAIEGNDITFTSLDGQKSVVNLPDSLKSVAIDGNMLTFTSLDGTPSVINLPVTTGYLSDVSLSDGTLVFTKDGSSDVRVTLPFISKAITGVSLQGSNLVFTFSDNTTANITLPTQSEGGTTAGLLSGVRIDGNKLIFTVSGGNDITIELPSTSGGSGDVDLTGLLLNPSYSKGTLSFDTKDGSTKTVNLDGIANIHGNLSGDNLEYEDLKGTIHQVSLSSLTRGVLTGIRGATTGYLAFTAKDSEDVYIPLSHLTASGVLMGVSIRDGDLVFNVAREKNTHIPLGNLTASGVLTGVSLSDDNLVFTVKGGDNITIPLSSSSGGESGVTNVTVDNNGNLFVGKSGDSDSYKILPRYTDNVNMSYGYTAEYGWGGSLGFNSDVWSDISFPYSPIGVPNGVGYMHHVILSSHKFDYITNADLDLSTSSTVGTCIIKGNHYVSNNGGYTGGDKAGITVLYCKTSTSESFSESSGTFTANVIEIQGSSGNDDYVLIDSSITFGLNSNILEAFPNSNTNSIINLLHNSYRFSHFKGFAFNSGDFYILINKDMFFAKQIFDWGYNVTNSFGMRVYLGSDFGDSFTTNCSVKAGKVLD